MGVIWVAVGAVLVVLLAHILPGTLSPVAAVDFDERLRQAARELAKGAAASRMQRVAVEPFTDLEGKVSQLGRVLADELTIELTADHSVQVIDQRQLVAYLEKRSAVLLSGFSRQELSKVGKELDLDGVVAGSAVESANQIRLTVKLISVKSGHLVAAAKTTLPKADFLAALAEPAITPSPPLERPDPAPTPSAQTQPPEGMILVPAGSFLYGEGDQERTLTLPAFWIDVFEVTNGRYGEFREREYKLIESHRPVTNVSWSQARQFCRFYGKRLPTEQEWEKAARGEDGRQYPWGNAYDPALVNSEGRHRGPTDVGKFEDGRSPYGLYDMAGNVMEWTDSGDDQIKVYRGGSWASPPSDVRTAIRGSIAPAYRLPDLGFRCAMDGPK
jgi:formylglycine-generating enzyme required for sulfatase activity